MSNINESFNGIVVRDFTDDKFKTARVSVHFILPLDRIKVSAYALIPSILTQSTKLYPDMTILSRYLSELYGADLGFSVSKIGDNQVLSISVAGISDKYALENEKLSEEYVNLLCESIFNPLKGSDGFFDENAFVQQQRQLLEAIDADFNEKRVYARLKAQEIMFKGEPAEIRKYGTKDSVKEVKREELVSFWEYIKKNAKIEIFVLGDCNYSLVCDKFKSYFTKERTPVALVKNTVINSSSFKEDSEEMKLAQSKLILGFRTGVNADNTAATRLMCAIYGGTVSSKLFLNIREKMSLCYYCSSSLKVEKAAMIVESGVETANLEKAKEAILKEFDDMKKGEFSDDDIHFAKLAMGNNYKYITDSLYATENWYLSQVLSDRIVSPDEMEQKVLRLGKEDVVQAANKVSLDTVYSLKGVSVDE